ncbi:hypothetical protein Q9251_01730 [Alkalihalobacillus macyae]|uniref:hypothetical protein n=1 Tax=Guptibacillus hwajinpoensis TaxID=208199 RepID=UPI00273C9591|nr:hypothetical protein [Alkalihalobacillus macyae]MDP4549598.1 hypothetical protein [Alkalihalobacillus macyae]
MKFQYNLTGTGWATCIVEINSQVLKFSASYLTDCLGDLVQALYFLNPLRSDEGEKASIEWEGEPEGILWAFILKESNILSIEATYYEDMENKENGNQVIQTEYSYDEFLKVVLIELDSIIKRHGIVGYKEQWVMADFPLRTFLELKHYCLTKEDYPLTEVMVESLEETTEEIRSSLVDDLGLLMRSIK